MDSSIIVAVISAVVTIFTVILNNKASNEKIQHKLETSQAVTDTKIESLTAEVREHNNYARRMPVVEEQIRVLNHRVSDLERKHENP